MGRRVNKYPKIIAINFRLLGKHDAFSLGFTFNPETYGIWMGTHVLRGRNNNGKPFTVILLDTEGIGKEVRYVLLNKYF